METTTLDLWPTSIDIDKLPDITTPISILKEQASLLGQKTKNIVEAEVKSTDAGNGRISVSFNLVAPALNKYRYQLFQITHHGIELYPVGLSFSNRSYTANSPEQFIEHLKKILADEKTKSVIQSLIAQSRS
ncbi:MAG: hypothetical protein JNM09_16970 [Blastocatellia bacterium]|nr:hypothetical protein [Blastocatellia bacterium]